MTDDEVLVAPGVESTELITRITRTVVLQWDWYDAPWATGEYARQYPARITEVRLTYTWSGDRWLVLYTPRASGYGVKKDGGPYAVAADLSYRLPRDLADALAAEHRPTTSITITEEES